MSESMVGSWELDNIDTPAQYFAFAKSYLRASQALCKQMVSDGELQSWPHANVVMMLAAHAVELFLKGAIIIRSPAGVKITHDLWELKDHYDTIFPEAEFAWEIPFSFEYVGTDQEEIARLQKNHPVPSMQYRYPDKKPGVSWGILAGFQPAWFVQTLHGVYKDFERLSEKLEPIKIQTLGHHS